MMQDNVLLRLVVDFDCCPHIPRFYIVDPQRFSNWTKVLSKTWSNPETEKFVTTYVARRRGAAPSAEFDTFVDLTTLLTVPSTVKAVAMSD
jgi:hypothetical protein